MSSFQENEAFQNQHWENIDFNEEERELEEALSLADLPITTGNEENEAKFKEDTQKEQDNLDLDFNFGSFVGSINALDGEMCTADEIFSGGQILPYRNSVSSTSELRSFSRSESMDRRGFESRSNSSRSSSIRSRYSTTSSGSSNCSNNTIISSKTVPVISKVQNQFHSYPSPKPQILSSNTRISTHASHMGKKSKMWEVLKLGLIRTPKIELQDLKIHHRTSNFGKSSTFPSNNSISSNSNSSNNNNEPPRKSGSNEGNRINDFVLEMQKRKSKQQLLEKEVKNGGVFKSCKFSIGAIDPLPTRQGNNQYNSSINQVSNKDKNLVETKLEQQEEEQKRSSEIRQGKEVMSHHQHRIFEWVTNLSHPSILNS